MCYDRYPASIGTTLVVQRRAVARVWVVLALASIVVIVHFLSLLLGVALGLFAVIGIQALGLEQLVNFGTGECCEKFFGGAVTDSLT